MTTAKCDHAIGTQACYTSQYTCSQGQCLQSVGAEVNCGATLAFRTLHLASSDPVRGRSNLGQGMYRAFSRCLETPKALKPNNGLQLRSLSLIQSRSGEQSEDLLCHATDFYIAIARPSNLSQKRSRFVGTQNSKQRSCCVTGRI